MGRAREWVARASPCTTPLLPHRPTHPLLIIFDGGWFCDDGRRTHFVWRHGSCGGAIGKTRRLKQKRRCRFVVRFNFLFQCDRSARRDLCRRPCRIIVWCHFRLMGVSREAAVAFLFGGEHNSLASDAPRHAIRGDSRLMRHRRVVSRLIASDAPSSRRR